MNDAFSLVQPGRHEPRSPTLLTERELPRGLHDLRVTARDFIIDQELADALNVALAVGAPLLLSGEPGTGKTQLAYYLAWYFGIETSDCPDEWRQPFAFHVKSTSVARDLLYTFDTVAYFHDAQSDARRELDKAAYVDHGALWLAIDAVNQDKPAIVLIDEIDKAPRDFPNDLLHELDQYRFRVTETGDEKKRAPGKKPPVIIITSNSEKRLPAAFLRRCIVHKIEFNEQTIRHAVGRRRARGQLARLDDATIDVARARFMDLRDNHDLQKKPSTAEFLAWLVVLDLAGLGAAALEKTRSVSELPHLSVLVKDSEDRAKFG
jgi:MoxR-like ATPase